MAYLFEYGTKVKIPSEIKPPLNLDDIYELASNQIHRLFPDDVKSETLAMETDEDGEITFFEDSEVQQPVKKLSLHEQAQLKWKEQQEKKKFKSAQKKPDFVIDLCKSYAKCGSPGDIPPLLKKLFNALQSIPPTSVESERAFSITGQFATKLRTKLADNTLSSLVFLKASYKKESKILEQ